MVKRTRRGDVTVHLDLAVLLEEEEKHAADLVGDVGSPLCLVVIAETKRNQIVVHRNGHEHLRLLRLPLPVALHLRNRLRLDDLAHVLATERVGVARRRLHQNVGQFVQNDNGNLVGLQQQHVRLNRLLRNGVPVLSTAQRTLQRRLDIHLLLANGFRQRIEPLCQKRLCRTQRDSLSNLLHLRLHRLVLLNSQVDGILLQLQLTSNQLRGEEVKQAALPDSPLWTLHHEERAFSILRSSNRYLGVREHREDGTHQRRHLKIGSERNIRQRSLLLVDVELLRRFPPRLCCGKGSIARNRSAEEHLLRSSPQRTEPKLGSEHRFEK